MYTAGFVATVASTKTHGFTYQKVVILEVTYTFQRSLDIKM
jgi:hypothetical protein